MFFSSRIVLLPLLVMLIGCGGENKPLKDIPEVHMRGSKCLSNTFSKIENYFDGRSTVSEANGVWSCFSHILNEFNTYVRGRNHQRYTSQELRNFLEFYFLSEYKPRAGERHLISDGLLTEFMVVKQLFLGGASDSITHDELKEALVFIEEMRAMTVEFLPHSRILLSDDQSLKPTASEMDASTAAVERAVGRLLNRFADKSERYEFSHLIRLLRELYDFFVVTNGDSRMGPMDQLVPVFGHFKYLILNTDAQALVQSDYANGARIVGRLTGIYLRLKFYAKKSSFYEVAAINHIQQAVDLFSAVAHEGIQNRDGQPIPTSDFEQFVTVAGEAGILPFRLSVDEMRGFGRLIIDSILSHEVALSDSTWPGPLDNPLGLNTQKVNYLQTQTSDFLRVQKMFIEGREDADDQGWREIQALLAGPWSLNLDDGHRLVFSGEAGDTNMRGRTRLNWLRKLIRPLTRYYIEEADRQGDRLELSEAEIGRAAEDLRPLLVGMGLIGPDDLTFYKSVFREANLFMPRADGNGFLSYTELMEWVYHVLAGMNAADYFIEHLPATCVSENESVEASCFRDQFIELRATTLAHMPKYLQYTAGLSPQGWQLDMNLIEGIARNVSQPGEPLLHSEVIRAFVFIQYIESLILRFDSDRTAELTLPEGLVAYPHFQLTLAKILWNEDAEEELESEENRIYLESFFTFLVRYGNYPGDGGVDTELRFLEWRWHRDQWHFNASRGSLLQILSTLNQIGRR